MTCGELARWVKKNLELDEDEGYTEGKLSNKMKKFFVKWADGMWSNGEAKYKISIDGDRVTFKDNDRKLTEEEVAVEIYRRMAVMMTIKLEWFMKLVSNHDATSDTTDYVSNEKEREQKMWKNEFEKLTVYLLLSKLGIVKL